MRKRLLLAAVAALAVLAGHPGGAAGGFGASLTPIELVWEKTQVISVRNKSDIPIVATFTVEGAGWELAEASATLAVDEVHRVTVTKAGQEDAVIRVAVTPATPTKGMESVSIVLEGKARHQTWFEANDVRPYLVGGAALLALIGWFGWQLLAPLRHRPKRRPTTAGAA